MKRRDFDGNLSYVGYLVLAARGGDLLPRPITVQETTSPTGGTFITACTMTFLTCLFFFPTGSCADNFERKLNVKRSVKKIAWTLRIAIKDH